VEQAVELYLRGWGLTRIGEHFGKGHIVVRNALVRAGISAGHSPDDSANLPLPREPSY
jgi:hypothetical protein